MSGHDLADDGVGDSASSILGLTLPAGFETLVQSTAKDAERAKSLRRSGVPGAADLADRIDPATLPRSTPRTLASARYYRTVRKAFLRALEQVFVEFDDADLRFVTIVPPSWAVKAGELDSFLPTPQLAGFKVQLHRAGVLRLRQPLVAAVAGEFDATLGKYQLHLHALTTKAAADLIRSKLSSLDAFAATNNVKNPIDVAKIDNRGRAGAITYILKSYWPMRNRYLSQKSNELVRSREEQVLKPPQLAEVLLWMDKHRVGTLIYAASAKLPLTLRSM